VLVQERKLARASLPTWSDDFRDALVHVQEVKLASSSFPPWWNGVVRDVFLILQEENKT
jgi:hypothetical protein